MSPYGITTANELPKCILLYFVKKKKKYMGLRKYDWHYKKFDKRPVCWTKFDVQLALFPVEGVVPRKSQLPVGSP